MLYKQAFSKLIKSLDNIQSTVIPFKTSECKRNYCTLDIVQTTVIPFKTSECKIIVIG